MKSWFTILLFVFAGAHGSMSQTLQIKSLKMSNGLSLEYAEQGGESGIPVLLLHGYTDSWRSFEQVMKYLPSSLHAFSISLRGHGNSDKPAASYHAQEMAADIAEFVRARQLEPVVLVGHSMGSAVVQRFALEYPAYVRGAVLVSTFASFKTNPGLIELNTAVAAFNTPPDHKFVYEFQKSTIATPISEQQLQLYVAESLKVPVHVWKNAMKQLITVNYVAELDTSDKPFLIIWGNKDNLCPETDQKILSNALRCDLIVYDGAGHGVHWDQPRTFAGDIEKFARRVSALK